MAWNHRSAVVAMAVALQTTPGTFNAPNTTTDLIAVSVPNNNFEAITADDPTATGAIWKNKRIYLGKFGTAGATIPLRGPGGGAPPAANAWPVGRVLQAAGYAEVRNAAPIAHVTQAGSTTTTIVLANTESAVDKFYVGFPIQHANIGTGFRATSLISDYVGASKTATLPETIVAPGTGDAYTIPACLVYVQGTLTTAPPTLCVSIWRDQKRYDYMGWSPTSLSIDIPVTNEANTVFPSIDFSGKCDPAGVSDQAAPLLPDTILQVAVPPARGGKFLMDRTKLGHQSLQYQSTFDVGAASNQNQDAGQDTKQITGGTRSASLDVNEMGVTDFDIETRINSQTAMPIADTWGLGSGNNFGFVLPNVVLDPFSPGDRNGFVNLTGDAQPNVVDKAAALAIWW